MEDKIELKVLGITYNPVQSGAYALLLREVDGPYRIPIVVGASEAQSIAMRLENIIPPRPMSHDLMVSMMHAFGIRLEEVFIHQFNEGVFTSELRLDNGIHEITLDSRTSDAIALALRTDARIYTTPEIINKTGIVIETKEDDTHVARKPPKSLQEMPVEELKKRMDEAVEREEYERAAEIQKLIKARQQGSRGASPQKPKDNA